MKLVAFVCVGLLVGSGHLFAQSDSAIRFKPKLSVGAPPPELYRQDPRNAKKPVQHVVKHAPAAQEKLDDSEVICGMKVIRKGPELDPGIIVKPSARSGAAIRRITPPVCTGSK